MSQNISAVALLQTKEKYEYKSDTHGIQIANK